MVDGIHENNENWAPTKYNYSTVYHKTLILVHAICYERLTIFEANDKISVAF